MTSEAFQVGETVAILQWDKCIDKDRIVRLTKTQGILASDRKFRLSDGNILADGSFRSVCKMTPDRQSQLNKAAEERAIAQKLAKSKADCRSGFDAMMSQYFIGFTVEELESVSNAVQSALAIRKSRQEGRS